MPEPQGLADEHRYQWILANILPYENRVRRWLKHSAPSVTEEDVDDAIQEAYARIWQMPDFRRIQDASSYFKTTVLNVVYRQAHRAKIVPMERMSEIEMLDATRYDPGPEARVSARQQLEHVQKVIDALPRRCRRAITLRKIYGWSQKEIAVEMSLSENTVEKHIAKGLGLIVQSMGRLDSENDETQRRRSGRKKKIHVDDR